VLPVERSKTKMMELRRRARYYSPTICKSTPKGGAGELQAGLSSFGAGIVLADITLPRFALYLGERRGDLGRSIFGGSIFQGRLLHVPS
jgi:hypothetical protein